MEEEVRSMRNARSGDFRTVVIHIDVVFQAVFERLVDIICDKMSESLDSDPNLMNAGSKGTRLTEQGPQGPQNPNCNC